MAATPTAAASIASRDRSLRGRTVIVIDLLWIFNFGAPEKNGFEREARPIAAALDVMFTSTS
jgi:hypothetical protein